MPDDDVLKPLLESHCGVPSLYGLVPDEEPPDAACIAATMRAAGASADAIQFFEETHLFLFEFLELGTVDLGIVAAPWLFMGRGQRIFLNGSPRALLLHDAYWRDADDAPVRSVYVEADSNRA